MYACAMLKHTHLVENRTLNLIWVQSPNFVWDPFVGRLYVKIRTKIRFFMHFNHFWYVSTLQKHIHWWNNSFKLVKFYFAAISFCFKKIWSKIPLGFSILFIYVSFLNIWMIFIEIQLCIVVKSRFHWLWTQTPITS